MKSLICRVVVAVILLSMPRVSASAVGSGITGELRQWHKVTLTLEGPHGSEDGNLNPFLDYRMQVTFRHTATGLTYVVPGYFAADGDAGNTSATSGNKWRAHLSPDNPGEWTYAVSFRQGPSVALDDAPAAGSPVVSVDGLQGALEIAKTDKSGRDFRGKGRLNYVGKHHLQFAETGEFFLKTGVDAPENFLAYNEFDGEFRTDGHKDHLVKDWGPHVQDWQPGDPTWQGGKGKGIIGAINYLASQGLNSFSFLTLNIIGDDRNVFPYTNYDERVRFDCSRMDQWETVFAHGDKLGMYLHFKTQEAENVNLLDDGNLGPQRKLYYRELIARFGHHLALNWNLGEEVGLYNKVATKKKVAWANYFWKHDPYQHHIVIHNGDNHFDLLGDASRLTGFSLQTNMSDFRNVHSQTLRYIRQSVAAGKPWVVACDEPGDATHSLLTDSEDATHDNARSNALWGNIMAGGAGVEWYFGYKHPHSDLTCQDFRVRQNMWRQCRHAIKFFADQKIPFWKMPNANEKLDSKAAYCLHDPGKLYLVYRKYPEQLTLDLTGAEGVFEVQWFNPRTGGPLQLGTAQAIRGGGKVLIGNPPSELGKDWLAVVRPGDPNRDYPPAVSAGADRKVMLPRSVKAVTVDLSGHANDDRKPSTELTSRWTKRGGPGEAHFLDSAALNTQVTLHGAGTYVLNLTANDGKQSADANVTVTVERFHANITRRIRPVEDAYMEAKAGVNNQHLKVEGNRRVAYLKFVFRDVPPSISKVQLKLTEAGDPGDGTLRVFRGAHADWTGAKLTHQSAPTPGEMLGEQTVNVGSGGDIVISLKPSVIRNGATTLILMLDEGGNDIWFGSTESANSPELLVTLEDPQGRYTRFGEQAASSSNSPPFEFTYDPKQAKIIHQQTDGIVVVEAEDFDAVDRQDHRKWRLTTADKTPGVKPDPDPNHAAGASGGAYLELLPDTRVTHADPLVNGVSFANTPGQCSVLYYPVMIEKPGRYYVWVRMCCTGSEDNGLHVGLDGHWPASGARLQFTGQHGKWQWDSRQRTAKAHAGVLGQIWLDIETPGLHTVMFSMREDGFEFDKFLLTPSRKPMESRTGELGPPSSPRLEE